MQIFIFLLPQLILFLGVVLVFSADLVGSKEKKWLPYLALAGALLSLAASIYLFGWGDIVEKSVLGGMLAPGLLFPFLPDFRFPCGQPGDPALHGLYGA